MSAGTIDTATGPIAAILDFEGAAAEDYRRLCDRLHPSCRHRRLQGCLYHWMRTYPEGFRVIEFWTGLELFQWFLDHEFRPVLHELGLAEPLMCIEAVPEDAVFEVDDDTQGDGDEQEA